MVVVFLIRTQKPSFPAVSSDHWYRKRLKDATSVTSGIEDALGTDT